MKNEIISYARNSNFIFDFPDHQFQFYIQEGMIPGFSLGELTIPHVSQRVQRFGDMIDWNPLSITIILNENFDSFIELYNYIIGLKNPETAKMKEYKAGTFTGILNILSNKKNWKFNLYFYDAWIKSFGDVQFTTTDEDEVITSIVEINYSYYTINFEKGEES